MLKGVIQSGLSIEMSNQMETLASLAGSGPLAPPAQPSLAAIVVATATI